MLRSLDFQIQIIKFCIRGLLKYIAQETRQNVKWLGTKLSETERTKLQGLNDLLLFLNILWCLKMKIAKQMELLTSLGNNTAYAQKSFRKKLAFHMKCCGSVKINQKQKGKRQGKVITFLLLKARRHKGVAPNQLQLLFIQMVPPTGSGGQNRLRMSQRGTLKLAGLYQS